MPDKKEKLTAKEIEHDIFWDIVMRVDCKGGFLITKAERIELIKEYARQKCKEQRELCAKRYKTDNRMERQIPIKDRILSAIAPEFD